MLANILFVLLPALALAEISVVVRGVSSVGDSTAQAFGSTVDIISDQERDGFRINDGQLKDAVGKFAGRRPDDAYVKSPTPWNDLYRSFGWSQVRRIVTAKSARVINMRTEPVIVAKKNYRNDSPYPAKYTGDVSQMEDNTVSHRWSKQGSLTVGQKITYSATLGVGSVGGTTSFSFKNSFGEENVNTVQTKLGSSLSISFTLQPKQTATAVLAASKGTMEVEVEYEATLEGDVATNYGSPHKGHHFWAYAINSVLQAGGLPTSITWKEVISIGFFADESITAYDGRGNKL